jgi:hypothetical protein
LVGFGFAFGLIWRQGLIYRPSRVLPAALSEKINNLFFPEKLLNGA